jgi:hypothetical protein
MTSGSSRRGEDLNVARVPDWRETPSVVIDAHFFQEAANAQYLSSISETLWPGTEGRFRPRCGRITRKPQSVVPMGMQHHFQYVTEQIASRPAFKGCPELFNSRFEGDE